MSNVKSIKKTVDGDKITIEIQGIREEVVDLFLNLLITDPDECTEEDFDLPFDETEKDLEVIINQLQNENVELIDRIIRLRHTVKELTDIIAEDC